MNDAMMTNERVLRAAGVSAEEIEAIKTADATLAVHTLDAIHKKLMAFVYEQRIEWANQSNPLSVLERSYADYNGGSLNGAFQETLIPTREKGADGLYGGTPYVPGEPFNPWANPYYGEDPIQYTYSLNASIHRGVDWTYDDFLMFFRRGSLIDYVRSRVSIMEAESTGTRYAIENNVLNCEAFQNVPYADAPKFYDAATLSPYMHKVWASQKYNGINTQYKRVPFNTTRRNGDLIFVLNETFFYEYAQKFQFNSFLKPFVSAAENGEYSVNGAQARVVLVDELTPTTLAQNAILDPLKMTKATLPAGTKLVGRIVDINAVKFGIGTVSARDIPLDARNTHYDEVRDYVFDMCDAYVNVPILVTDDFSADRVISVKTAPAPANVASK